MELTSVYQGLEVNRPSGDHDSKTPQLRLSPGPCDSAAWRVYAGWGSRAQGSGYLPDWDLEVTVGGNRQTKLDLEERSSGETGAKLHQGNHAAALPTGPLPAPGPCQASAPMILSL